MQDRKQIMIMVPVFALVGLLLLLAVRAARENLVVEPELSTTQLFGGASVEEDEAASKGSLIRFNERPIACDSFDVIQVDGQSINFNVGSNNVPDTITVDFGDGISEPKEFSEFSDKLNLVTHEYPVRLHDWTYGVTATVKDATGEIRCPQASVTIERPRSLANIEFIDPKPHHEVLSASKTAQDITDVLDDYTQQFAKRGEEIGSPAPVTTRVVQTQPVVVLETDFTPFTDNTTEEIDRYRAAGHAFLDAVSRMPVKLFNRIGIDEIVIGNKLNGVFEDSPYIQRALGGRYKADTVNGLALNANQIKPSSMPANNPGDEEFHTFKTMTMRAIGLALDYREDLEGVSTAKIFFGEYAVFNPGGRAFEYGDWQSRWESLPQVEHGSQSYPAGFHSPHAIQSFAVDFTHLFAALFADNIYWDDGHTPTSSSSVFEDTLARAEKDENLTGKINTILKRLKRFEPELTIDVLKDLNNAYNCTYCQQPDPEPLPPIQP